MKGYVYTATEDGNILHIRTGKVIAVESFTIGKSGRGEVINIEKRGGGHKSVLRFQIDETAFSFGPGGEESNAKHGSASKRNDSRLTSPLPLGSNGRSIALTREEAVDLLHVARNLAELLSDKLINETIQRG